MTFISLVGSTAGIFGMNIEATCSAFICSPLMWKTPWSLWDAASVSSEEEVPPAKQPISKSLCQSSFFFYQLFFNILQKCVCVCVWLVPRCCVMAEVSELGLILCLWLVRMDFRKVWIRVEEHDQTSGPHPSNLISTALLSSLNPRLYRQLLWDNQLQVFKTFLLLPLRPSPPHPLHPPHSVAEPLQFFLLQCDK